MRSALYVDLVTAWMKVNANSPAKALTPSQIQRLMPNSPSRETLSRVLNMSGNFTCISEGWNYRRFYYSAPAGGLAQPDTPVATNATQSANARMEFVPRFSPNLKDELETDKPGSEYVMHIADAMVSIGGQIKSSETSVPPKNVAHFLERYLQIMYYLIDNTED